MSDVGVCLSNGWREDLVGADGYEQWQFVLGQARRAEELGYDSIWLMDHLQPVTNASAPLLECWSATAALAAATHRIRLGQIVTCNGYRPPALLAKMASTVDGISNGRLEFGIGAGWFATEFTAWGYEFPTAGTRLDMLAEAVRMIRALWTDSPATFVGRHYQLGGVDMSPKTVQRPHPPIWIGSRGERKGLRIVAELADCWNVVGSVDDFAAKHAVLRRHCEAIGRDAAEIRTSVKCDVVVGATDRLVDAQLVDVQAFWQARGVTQYADLAKYRCDHLVGTPAQIVERIAQYREAGCQYFICDFFDTQDSVELFARDVL